jgi:S1-C subfamily serine protease
VVNLFSTLVALLVLADYGTEVLGPMSLLRTFIFVFMAAALGFIHEAQADRRCGWIGAQVIPMTKAFAVSLGMAVPYGLIFEQPQPGSPTARTRIHAGDVVTRINGRPLTSTHDFEQRILAMAPGTRIHLRVFRNRQPIMFTVPLGSTECPPVPVISRH